MIQQVNLYLPEFRRRKDPLTLANMAAILLAGAALLGMISAWQYWELRGLNEELAQARAALNESVDSTAALLQGRGAQSEDRDLAAQVLAFEQRLAEKSVLLHFLDGGSLGNVEGFSEYLADLSRYHIPGLSLSGVELSEGGESVRLSGEVAQAENLPAYLQNLGKGRSYVGKSFAAVRIEGGDAQDAGILEFSVATGEGGE